MAPLCFRSLLLGIAVLLAASRALAQTPENASYPSQTVRLVVPFSAGSVTDLLARSIGDKLSERWGQQVIVENRPGIPGTASVAKAAADGHTFMLTSNGHTVAAVLNKNLPFDPIRDFCGVTQVASVPLVLIAPPELPVKTLKELVALAKDKPGTLNFASSGLASTAYISGELFKQTARINIVHVPYKGAPESLTGIMRSEFAHVLCRDQHCSGPDPVRKGTAARGGGAQANSNTAERSHFRRSWHAGIRVRCLVRHHGPGQYAGGDS